MTGLNWSYEDLCAVVPSFPHNSSSPTSAADLNPAIKQLLDTRPNSSIFSVGSRSVIIMISDDVLAKVSLMRGGKHLTHEQAILTLLDQKPCPNIVQTLLRTPDATFMQTLRMGTLHERIKMNKLPLQVLKWMQQLSDAVACVESCGYAHGDLNPSNILFDDKDQLRLVDFDHAVKLGNDLNVGYAPYVRPKKPGQKGGIYGIAGPITEQLALGSIFWFMTRGIELFHNLQQQEQESRLKENQFPVTEPQDPIDQVIKNCWLGKFSSISELSERIGVIISEKALQGKGTKL